MMILTKLLSDGSNPVSLKEAFFDKVAHDSKTLFKTMALGLVSLLFISVSIMLGVYYLFDLNMNITTNEKMGYTVLTLLVISGMMMGIVYKTINNKMVEYERIKDNSPDLVAPVREVLKPFVDQLKAERELMTKSKLSDFQKYNNEELLH